MNIYDQASNANQQGLGQANAFCPESQHERLARLYGENARSGLLQMLNEAEDRGRAKGVQSCDAELSKLRAEVAVLRRASTERAGLSFKDAMELTVLREWRDALRKFCI